MKNKTCATEFIVGEYDIRYLCSNTQIKAKRAIVNMESKKPHFESRA